MPPPPYLWQTPWIQIESTASSFISQDYFGMTTSPLGIYSNVLTQTSQIGTSGTAAYDWAHIALLQQSIATTTQTLTNQIGALQHYFAQFPDAFDVRMPHASQRVRRIGRSPAVIHAGRRAVRRSIDLYLRMRPAEELKTFLRGEAITIQGARFRYSLRKSRSIMEHTMNPHGGHTPYSLLMHDPSGNGRVYSGCVYLDRTPVIDQVLAFIMHVTDPEGERELIRQTNWTPDLPIAVWRFLREEYVDAPTPPLAIAA